MSKISRRLRGEIFTHVNWPQNDNSFFSKSEKKAAKNDEIDDVV
jgi:hypothetical protein